MEKKITGVLIVAAGKGVRSKSIVPKQYLQFGDQTVLEKNIENGGDQPSLFLCLFKFRSFSRPLDKEGGWPSPHPFKKDKETGGCYS